MASNATVARFERMKIQIEAQRKAGTLSEQAFKVAIAEVETAIRLAGSLPTRERGTTRDAVLEFCKVAKLNDVQMKEVGGILDSLDKGISRLRDLIGDVEVDIKDGKYAGFKGKPTPRYFCNVVPVDTKEVAKAKK